MPHDLSLTADGDRGLTTCTDSLWVYDVPTQSVAWEIPGFVDARNLAARLAGTRAYVNDQNEANNDWINETPLEGFPADLFLGAGDTRVYALDGNQLYVADSDGRLQSSAATPVFALTGFAVDLPVQ